MCMCVKGSAGSRRDSAVGSKAQLDPPFWTATSVQQRRQDHTGPPYIAPLKDSFTTDFGNSQACVGRRRWPHC